MVFSTLSIARAWTSVILAEKCDIRRHSTSGLSEIVVVAETSSRLVIGSCGSCRSPCSWLLPLSSAVKFRTPRPRKAACVAGKFGAGAAWRLGACQIEIPSGSTAKKVTIPPATRAKLEVSSYIKVNFFQTVAWMKVARVVISPASVSQNATRRNGC